MAMFRGVEGAVLRLNDAEYVVEKWEIRIPEGQDLPLDKPLPDAFTATMTLCVKPAPGFCSWLAGRLMRAARWLSPESVPFDCVLEWFPKR